MNDTDVAARLAEALTGLPTWVADVDPGEGPIQRRPSRSEIAAALLPVVREIADQRAAEQAAEAARLRAVVARVSAVADQWEAASRHLGLPDDEAEQARLAAELLRRALDGTDA